MPSQGCLKANRILLIVFNVIFWLSGIAVLTIGILLRANKNLVELQNVVEIDGSHQVLGVVAYLLISAGVFVFLIGFCGCCGAATSNKFLIGFYIFLLTVIFAIEIAGGALAYKSKDEIIDKLTTTLTKHIKKNYKGNSSISSGIDVIQHKFQCCGVIGYADYVDSDYVKSRDEKVPASCCILKDPDNIDYSKPIYKDKSACFQQSNNSKLTESGSLNVKGCYSSVKQWVKDNMGVVIGVTFFFGMSEIIGFVSSIIFCANAGKLEEAKEPTETKMEGAARASAGRSSYAASQQPRSSAAKQQAQPVAYVDPQQIQTGGV